MDTGEGACPAKRARVELLEARVEHLEDSVAKFVFEERIASVANFEERMARLEKLPKTPKTKEYLIIENMRLTEYIRFLFEIRLKVLPMAKKIELNTKFKACSQVMSDPEARNMKLKDIVTFLKEKAPLTTSVPPDCLTDREANRASATDDFRAT